jgi:hypothetical protein
VGPDAATCTKSRDVIEGAWTYCMQVRVSRKLYDRLEALPQDTCDIAYKAQVVSAAAGEAAVRGKPSAVVTSAISHARWRASSGPSCAPSSAADDGLIDNEAVV